MDIRGYIILGAIVFAMMLGGVAYNVCAPSPEPPAPVAAPAPAPVPLTDAVKQAMDELCSDDKAARVAAAGTLGRSGKDAVPAVEALVAALTSDYEAEVRGAAAKALGKIPGSGAVASLVNVAANDGELEVRKEAIGALGDLKAPEAVGVLLDAITVKETRDVAQVALGQIGDPAVEPLIDRMTAGDAAPAQSAGELRETNKAVPPRSSRRAGPRR